jgi:hypothetical protein
MTTSVGIPSTTAVRDTPRTSTLTAAALAGALSAAAFIGGFVLFPSQTFREGMLTPYSILNNVVTTLAFAVLAAATPTLRRVLDVPRWALYLTAAAFAGIAAMSWSLATLAPDMAKFVSDKEFDTFTVYLVLFPLPKMLLGLVGFIALGVTGWRRRAIPRGSSVLLVLAGLASLWWAYPPAALLSTLALAWIVRSVESSPQR